MVMDDVAIPEHDSELVQAAVLDIPEDPEEAGLDSASSSSDSEAEQAPEPRGMVTVTALSSQTSSCLVEF